ncbi:MAG: cation:proton antiporter [Deltaproteobacteria bacterium]|nr:cation:proton antiporter [Deltaproteobacteria bacterium]
MEHAIFTDIVIILGLSTVVVFVFHRLRLPVIVGFLTAGYLAGPHGLGLVPSMEEAPLLVEIGVVLLLFTIGVEFSLKNLFAIRRLALLGGGVQVGTTIAAFFGLFVLLDQPPAKALFWGFLASLSSTAIVLRILQEKDQVVAPHGRAAVGILIFQDVAVVPMMLAAPLLAGQAGGVTWESAGTAAGKMVLVLAFLWTASRFLVPRLLYQVARTRSREIFLLSVIVICLATAWFTYEAGLSLALGAFLAGLMISESEYNDQALGSILPFRIVFASFFFVSIGMLFDPAVLAKSFLLVAGLTVFVLAVKAVTASSACLAAGLPLRTSVLAGLALAQVGEFSFVLSKSGLEHGLLSQEAYGVFLSCTVLTMALTPGLIALAPAAAKAALAAPFPRRWKRPPIEERGPERENHLVIVGFGLNGKNVAAAAASAGIPYVVIETNPDTVRRERRAGRPILFGDASLPEVLEHAHIHLARVAVVAINDAPATRAVVKNIRDKNPGIHLIVRTRFLDEIGPLRELGADEVIPEEFETSVEIFARVLDRYQVPRTEIEAMVEQVRENAYGMFRSLSTVSTAGDTLDLPQTQVVTLRVCEGSPLVGKTLASIRLRTRYGVTVLAVRRKGETLPNPDPGLVFTAGDAMVLLGAPDQVRKAGALFADASCPLPDHAPGAPEP